MLEVIDQYGAHHRFDDSHVVHNDEGDKLEIAKESEDGYYDIVATFPHPAAYGKVGAFDGLSLREAPNGVVLRIAELEARVKEFEYSTASPGIILALRFEIRILRTQLAAHQSALKVAVEALESAAQYFQRHGVTQAIANEALAKIKEIVK